MRYYYCGQFPPPYGGVTVKNALLLNALTKRIPINKLGFRDVSTARIVGRLLLSKNDRFLFGFGNERLQRSLVCLLSHIKPEVLSRCDLIAMGGMLSNHLSKDRKYREACSKLRNIYVETQGMVDRMIGLGLHNASLYPNCRERPPVAYLPKETKEQLKCVSFSLIGFEKGADIILEAAKSLKSVEFHFYGQIEPGFAKSFKGEIANSQNVFYHGVFDSVRGDVLTELSKYDLHLFPTRWRAEGVPGVLVETKIAAVPSIVSDICYNAELVQDGLEGVVMSELNAETLAETIERLKSNPHELDMLKAGALASSERFYIDRYIDTIVTDLVNA